MANDGLSAGDRWVATVTEEIRRFKSLRPRPGRAFRFTPMPPEVRASQMKLLGVWPYPQSKRDEIVDMVAKKMAGLLGTLAQRHGVIPEPEASRAAADLEAEAYAAGKDLSTEEKRFEIFTTYGKELWSRAYRYADSRRQAAAGTTSRAAGSSAAQPPPAASVPGPVQGQPPKRRRSLRRHLPPPPQE